MQRQAGIAIFVHLVNPVSRRLHQSILAAPPHKSLSVFDLEQCVPVQRIGAFLVEAVPLLESRDPCVYNLAQLEIEALVIGVVGLA